MRLENGIWYIEAQPQLLDDRHHEGKGHMDERQTITIAQRAGEAQRVSLSTPEEIECMSDLQAIERIDELRAAARMAESLGLEVEARTLYANACDIVEHNLIVPETIGEYADLLESQGLSDIAAGYRTWHKEFTEALAQYDLPARGYEARLRIEATRQYKRADASSRTHSPEGSRERIGDAVTQARSASQSLGQAPSRELPSPVPGRGLQ